MEGSNEDLTVVCNFSNQERSQPRRDPGSKRKEGCIQGAQRGKTNWSERDGNGRRERREICIADIAVRVSNAMEEEGAKKWVGEGRGTIYEIYPGLQDAAFCLQPRLLDETEVGKQMALLSANSHIFSRV